MSSVSVSDVLDLVNLVRGGVAENGPQIMIKVGKITISLGEMWESRRGGEEQVLAAGPMSVPVSIEGCCDELQAQLSGDGSRMGPLVEAILLRLLEKLIQELTERFFSGN